MEATVFGRIMQRKKIQTVTAYYIRKDSEGNMNLPFLKGSRGLKRNIMAAKSL